MHTEDFQGNLVDYQCYITLCLHFRSVLKHKAESMELLSMKVLITVRF